jgi:hypothetical protein
MSRIEDNEAERAERLKQEQRLQQKAVDAKKIELSRQFSTVVTRMQETRGQNNKQDAERNAQKQSASRNVMARNGIVANNAQGQMLTRRAGLHDESRRIAQDKEGERTQQRAGLKQEQQAKANTSGETRAVTGGGKKQGQDANSRNQEPSRTTAEKDAAAQTSMTFSVQVHATANAIDGVGGRTGALTGGAPATLTAKEVIDQIVSQVRAGMDSKGFGLIQIDLRDDVLAGSRLTFLSSASGVHLKVETGDQDVERLLSSGQTANELSRAMTAARITLTGLEVNGTRVLGSAP